MSSAIKRERERERERERSWRKNPLLGNPREAILRTHTEPMTRREIATAVAKKKRKGAAKKRVSKKTAKKSKKAGKKSKR